MDEVIPIGALYQKDSFPPESDYRRRTVNFWEQNPEPPPTVPELISDQLSLKNLVFRVYVTSDGKLLNLGHAPNFKPDTSGYLLLPHEVDPLYTAEATAAGEPLDSYAGIHPELNRLIVVGYEKKESGKQLRRLNVSITREEYARIAELAGLSGGNYSGIYDAFMIHNNSHTPDLAAPISVAMTKKTNPYCLVRVAVTDTGPQLGPRTATGFDQNKLKRCAEVVGLHTRQIDDLISISLDGAFSISVPRFFKHAPPKPQCITV
ncbi:MAG: hypothetical protein HY431_00325 [Candidatus Levybacteria bacterium]|nr:hypothetical protein [Candidatus Levybacteria bacterium]